MASTPPTILSRKEAKALGLTRFLTGEPCKHGHVGERSVSSGQCLECSLQRRRAQRAANLEEAREKERERTRKYRAADPERARENWRRWQAKDKLRRKRAEWYAKNRDQIAAKQAAKLAANPLKARRHQRRIWWQEKRRAEQANALNRAPESTNSPPQGTPA
jgi:hypothetical protein